MFKLVDRMLKLLQLKLCHQRLRVLQNYFNGSIKLFSDLYLAEFLVISKSFFPCTKTIHVKFASLISWYIWKDHILSFSKLNLAEMYHFKYGILYDRIKPRIQRFEFIGTDFIHISDFQYALDNWYKSDGRAPVATSQHWLLPFIRGGLGLHKSRRISSRNARPNACECKCLLSRNGGAI